MLTVPSEEAVSRSPPATLHHPASATLPCLPCALSDLLPAMFVLPIATPAAHQQHEIVLIMLSTMLILKNPIMQDDGMQQPNVFYSKIYGGGRKYGRQQFNQSYWRIVFSTYLSLPLAPTLSKGMRLQVGLILSEQMVNFQLHL
jgi:hypothetical protein